MNSLIKFLAEIAQLVEHQFPKLKVASSSLVFRSIIKRDVNCYIEVLGLAFGALTSSSESSYLKRIKLMHERWKIFL